MDQRTDYLRRDIVEIQRRLKVTCRRPAISPVSVSASDGGAEFTPRHLMRKTSWTIDLDSPTKHIKSKEASCAAQLASSKGTDSPLGF